MSIGINDIIGFLFTQFDNPFSLKLSVSAINHYCYQLETYYNENNPNELRLYITRDNSVWCNCCLDDDFIIHFQDGISNAYITLNPFTDFYMLENRYYYALSNDILNLFKNKTLIDKFIEKNREFLHDNIYDDIIVSVHLFIARLYQHCEGKVYQFNFDQVRSISRIFLDKWIANYPSIKIKLGLNEEWQQRMCDSNIFDNKLLFIKSTDGNNIFQFKDAYPLENIEKRVYYGHDKKIVDVLNDLKGSLDVKFS